MINNKGTSKKQSKSKMENSVKCKGWKTKKETACRISREALVKSMRNDVRLYNGGAKVNCITEYYTEDDFVKMFFDIERTTRLDDDSTTETFINQERIDMCKNVDALIEKVRKVFGVCETYAISDSSRIETKKDKTTEDTYKCYKFSQHLVIADLYMKATDLVKMKTVFAEEIAANWLDGNVFNKTRMFRQPFGMKGEDMIADQYMCVYDALNDNPTKTDSIHADDIEFDLSVAFITGYPSEKARLIDLSDIKDIKPTINKIKCNDLRDTRIDERGWEKYVERIENKREATIYRLNLRILFKLPEICKHYEASCRFIAAFQYMEEKLDVNVGGIYMMWIGSREDDLHPTKDYLERYRTFTYDESLFNPMTFFNKIAEEYEIRHVSDMSIAINKAHLDFVDAQSRPPFDTLNELVEFINGISDNPMNDVTRYKLADKLYRSFATTTFHGVSSYMVKTWNEDFNNVEYTIYDIKTNRGIVFYNLRMRHFVWDGKKEAYKIRTDIIDTIFQDHRSQIHVNIRYGSVFDKINSNNTINLTQLSKYDIKKDDNYDVFSEQFTHFIKTVLLGNESRVDYWFHFLMCWFRRMHIERKKTNRILIVTGAQGLGKTLLFSKLHRWIAEKTIKVMATIEKLSDNFTDMNEKLVCLCFEEIAYTKTQWNNLQILKDLSTSNIVDETTKNKKTRVCKNNMSVVILSNDDAPILIKEDERRYVQFNMKDGGSKERNAELGWDFHELLENNISNFLYFINEHGNCDWLKTWQKIALKSDGLKIAMGKAAMLGSSSILHELTAGINASNKDHKNRLIDYNMATFSGTITEITRLIYGPEMKARKQIGINLLTAGFKMSERRRTFTSFTGKRGYNVEYSIDAKILREPIYELEEITKQATKPERTDIYDIIEEDNTTYEKITAEYNGDPRIDNDVSMQLNQYPAGN